MKKLDAVCAREILDRSHAAWCEGDIEGVLACYSDNLYYWCNAGTSENTPYVLEGKPALRTFLRSITAVADSGSVAEYFKFADGVGRASIECFIRHRRTGLILSGSYRQIVTFRGRKIARLQEFHDAAKMAAFWRLVACEQSAQAYADE